MMRTHHVFGFLAAAVLASALGAGCEDTTKFVARCTSDAECVDLNGGRPDWYCDADVGRCACRSDDACGELEHCERLPARDGYCHPNRICEWNEDCEPGQFCDLQSSFCRETGCTMDLQCRQGEVCDLLSSTCVPGCRSDGDCSYRSPCLCPSEDGGLEACVCDATTEQGRLGCTLGTCYEDTCANDSHCEWGQRCVDNPDPENPLKVCVDDERGPYCGVCTPNAGDVTGVCQGTGNFCLADLTWDVSSFCGVNCINGEACPNGFRCADILVRTDNRCGRDSDCPAPAGGPSCTEDADCDAGWCNEDGKCAGFCMGGEGAKEGWCSCILDDQCPAQTCQNGLCSTTGKQCFDDEDCRGEIVCQKSVSDDREVGYCKIGQNCAPEQGISCLEVRELRGVH